MIVIVILLAGLNRMVDSILKSSVLHACQLIISDNCNFLYRISFPNQSFHVKTEPGSLVREGWLLLRMIVSTSPMLLWDDLFAPLRPKKRRHVIHKVIGSRLNDSWERPRAY